MKKENISTFGTIALSFLATSCCIGPAIFVVFGASVGFLGKFSLLEPLQPYFLGAAIIMLGYSFWKLYLKGKGEHQISAERLLVAAGLKANTDDLGIENVNIELDERGFIKVNDYLQTSQNHIYAAGDVTGVMPLETVAAKQGNIAALNMFENAGKTINYLEIPQAVFTSPEVASVGMTEEEYMAKYNVCLCRTISFEHVEKAAAIKDTRGLIRMVIDPKTMQVIGVHLVGPMAADIITTATYAIRNKMTIYDIRDTVHVFPTLNEIIKKVAQSFDQNLDDMACCVE